MNYIFVAILDVQKVSTASAAYLRRSHLLSLSGADVLAYFNSFPMIENRDLDI